MGTTHVVLAHHRPQTQALRGCHGGTDALVPAGDGDGSAVAPPVVDVDWGRTSRWAAMVAGQTRPHTGCNGSDQPNSGAAQLCSNNIRCACLATLSSSSFNFGFTDLWTAQSPPAPGQTHPPPRSARVARRHADRAPGKTGHTLPRHRRQPCATTLRATRQ